MKFKDKLGFTVIVIFTLLLLLISSGCSEKNVRISKTVDSYTREYPIADSQKIVTALVFSGFRLNETHEKGHFFVRPVRLTKSAYRSTFEIAVVWFPDEETTRLHVWHQKRNHALGISWVENMYMYEIENLHEELSIETR